ncbi:hypothetical protein V6N11_076687 [Hibiscus sabdariffa]|uniref:Uncharacterized protein n=1 Tax=Hibiscus sabdariffa TaxID=183260 RepID=A0ABR2A4B2_9ROSI
MRLVFSSPVVKATIEQSLNSTSSNSANTAGPIGLGFIPVIAPISTVFMSSANRNLYLNMRLQQGAAGVVIDLGDLKWLVENHQAAGLAGEVKQQQQTVSKARHAALVEIGKLLARF